MQNKTLIFAQYKMSEKTLKFHHVIVSKKEFHASQQAIDLSLVDTDKIFVSDKFKHGDSCSKYILAIWMMLMLLDLCVLYCLK